MIDTPRNKAPKYRKHKASGQAVVTLNGRDIYLGKHGSAASKREYNRVIGEWFANDQTAPVKKGEPVTVGMLILRHDGFVKARRNRATQLRVRAALRSVRKLYGHTLAADFGPVALKACRMDMVKRGICRTTANAYTSIIKAMFRQAAADEIIPGDVFVRLTSVAGLKRIDNEAPETERVGMIADSIIDQTLPQLPPVVADMVRVQRLTGMRPGEVCSMTAAQIDMTGKVWLYRPIHHKNEHRGQSRVVAIGPKAQRILTNYINRDLAAPLFSPTESEAARGREYVCGTQYSTATYRQAIKNACDRLKIDRWQPNQIRHTAATAIRKAHGLEAASAMLGHSLVETSQIYAESDLEAVLKLAAKVG